MSKELEALELFENSIADIHQQTAYEILKQALTPPTQEDLCEALKNYMYPNTRYRVNYNQSEKEFNGRIGTIVSLGSYLKTPKIIFEVSLPPHLLTMIGRFYEEENK